MVKAKDTEQVKFINAALDEDEQDNIILRGVLEQNSLYNLKVAPYQREVMPKTKIRQLVEAFEKSSVPDIELGMRGGKIEENSNGFALLDEVYIIDGLQRVTAARQTVEKGGSPRLGAIVHFNTTEESERKRFKILNTSHLRLSPNVLIRNMENESDTVALLRFLCKDKSFPLCEKVSWNQRMNRTELLSAFTFLKTTGFLLSRFGPTRTSTMDDLVLNLDKVYKKYGRTMMRDNNKIFWDFMDECYRIRYVTFKEGATFLKAGFLNVMALLLAEHSDFWDDSKLVIDRDLKKKIMTFPINDQSVSRLAGGGGASLEILYNMLIDHINKGKRENRLVRERKSYRVTPGGVLYEQQKKKVVERVKDEVA